MGFEPVIKDALPPNVPTPHRCSAHSWPRVRTPLRQFFFFLWSVERSLQTPKRSLTSFTWLQTAGGSAISPARFQQGLGVLFGPTVIVSSHLLSKLFPSQGPRCSSPFLPTRIELTCWGSPSSRPHRFGPRSAPLSFQPTNSVPPGPNRGAESKRVKRSRMRRTRKILGEARTLPSIRGRRPLLHAAPAKRLNGLAQRQKTNFLECSIWTKEQKVCVGTTHPPPTPPPPPRRREGPSYQTVCVCGVCVW